MDSIRNADSAQSLERTEYLRKVNGSLTGHRSPGSTLQVQAAETDNRHRKYMTSADMGKTENMNLTTVIAEPGRSGDKTVSAEYRHVDAKDSWPHHSVSTLYELWTHRCGSCAGTARQGRHSTRGAPYVVYHLGQEPFASRIRLPKLKIL